MDESLSSQREREREKRERERNKKILNSEQRKNDEQKPNKHPRGVELAVLSAF